MFNKKVLWRIFEIVLTELIVIVGMFSLLLAGKAIGITEPRITKLLPFIVLLTAAIIGGIKNKITLREFGIIVTWETGILAVIFSVIAFLPFLSGDRKEMVSFGIIWNVGYYTLVGVSEELFFRGYIRTRIDKENMWVWRWVSAIAFAALHLISSEEMNVVLFILLAAFGMVFSVLRDVTNSLLPLICFHTVWDILSQYSDSYGNVLWYMGDWILLLLAAFIYSRIHKGKED